MEKKIQGIRIHYDISDVERDVVKKFDDAIKYLEELEEDEYNKLIGSATRNPNDKTKFEIGYLKTKFTVTYDKIRYHLELVE